MFFWSCIIVYTFSYYQLNAEFFYFSTLCMLHYAPQHVSSSMLFILRRTNCITTASGIVTLCKQLYSTQVDSGLQSALHLRTVQLFTEGDDTRGCGDTICPPENEQEFCIKLVIWKSLPKLRFLLDFLTPSRQCRDITLSSHHGLLLPHFLQFIIC